MTLDEKMILMAWSRGLAGASARLAKRAWWVLQDQERRSPSELVGTWTNASEAQDWLLNFHTMGLVGLLDAPRAGRPSLHADKVLQALDRLSSLASDDRTLHRDKALVLQSLSQQERDALWREARRTGALVMRRRKGMDLGVPAPPGLCDLLAIHLGRGVKVLAFLPPSSHLSDQLNGLWLGVPAARLAPVGVQALRYDLLSALSVEIRAPRSAKKQTLPNSSHMKEDAHLEARVFQHIAQMGLANPGLITLELLVNMDSGP